MSASSRIFLSFLYYGNNVQKDSSRQHVGRKYHKCCGMMEEKRDRFDKHHHIHYEKNTQSVLQNITKEPRGFYCFVLFVSKNAF